MNNYPNLNLNHQLCFALYAATNAITRSYRIPLDYSGLTYTQYLVMLVLWEKDCIPVNKIAERLQLDAATLTPILKRIEIAGLINRQRKSDDERIVEINLTIKGRDLQHEISKVQQGIECQTGLCNEDFIQLRDSLQQLTQNMTSKTISE